MNLERDRLQAENELAAIWRRIDAEDQAMNACSQSRRWEFATGFVSGVVAMLIAGALFVLAL